MKPKKNTFPQKELIETKIKEQQNNKILIQVHMENL